jgi:hypothetical protein
MKQTAWIVAAFAAGMFASAAATRTRADTTPFPSWVTVGACFTAPNMGTEVVLEIQAPWVKTVRSENGTETWRNLAEATWLMRMSEDTCRQIRR